jgi:hypothetical protein
MGIRLSSDSRFRASNEVIEGGSSAGEVPEGQQQGTGGAQGLFCQLHSIQYADPKMVKAITRYPEPTRMKELQSWFGGGGQYKRATGGSQYEGVPGGQLTLDLIAR